MLKKILVFSVVLMFTACGKPVNNSGFTENNKKNSLKLTLNTKSLINSRVKSVDAFLTTNYADPFASGANPLGDNVVSSVNISAGSGILTFKNIPDGENYYAVFAAFDDVKDAEVRNNITREDQTILSTDKKRIRSTNSVTVTPEGFTYSDGGTKLKIKMKLDPLNSIDIIISPQKGDSTNLPITAGLLN